MPTQNRRTATHRSAAKRGGAAFLVVLLAMSIGLGTAHQHETGATVEHCAVCHVAGAAAAPAPDVALPGSQPLGGSSVRSDQSPLRPRLSYAAPSARAPPQHA